jgi:hypothetical protein
MKQKIERIDNFIRTLSTERFDRYLNLAQDNQDYALKLYASNAVLSEALYVPLQALEITLRNVVHECLQAEFGPCWFDKVDIVIMPNQSGMIRKAKIMLASHKKEVESSRIIPELPFGFWTAMFGSEYDDLWRERLYTITLPEKRKGVTKKTYSGFLAPIRKLRNRIAHHECILKFHLQNHYKNIDFLIGLMAPEAKHWMNQHSKFNEVYDRQKEILKPLFFGDIKNASGTK